MLLSGLINESSCLFRLRVQRLTLFKVKLSRLLSGFLIVSRAACNVGKCGSIKFVSFIGRGAKEMVIIDSGYRKMMMSLFENKNYRILWMNGNVHGKKCTQTTCMMKIQHYSSLSYCHRANIRFHNIGFPTGYKYNVNGTAVIPLSSLALL